MSMSHSRQAPTDIVRPFLWLAIFAFLIGFSLALAVGYSQVASIRNQAPTTWPAKSLFPLAP